MNTLLLSRLQFTFTMGYHILWPAFTIGLAWFIVFLHYCRRGTSDPLDRAAGRAVVAVLRRRDHLRPCGFAVTMGLGDASRRAQPR
jgi:hypothetical protein